VPASFTHDEKAAARLHRFLGPLLLVEVVGVGMAMWAWWTFGDSGTVPGSFAVLGPVALAVAAPTAIWWLLRVRIHVDDRLYRVQLWPFPLRSEVPVRSIRDVYVREVRPLRQYGGWGVRWRRRGDVLYSLGGKKAVTVEYRRKGQTRKLTVTTERADEVFAALTG